MHVDNLGQPLSVGDFVLCLTGQKAYSFQTVKKLSSVPCEPFEPVPTVVFESGGMVYASNVLSMAPFGIAGTVPTGIGSFPLDLAGRELHCGDKVLFRHPLEAQCQTGTVKKLSRKTVLLSIPENRFGQTEYRKKYSEVLLAGN